MNPEIEILMRISLATLIGAAIGMERQKHGRVAGIRSFSTIGLGVCALVILGKSRGGGTIDSVVLAAIIVGLGILSAKFGLNTEEGIDLSNITAIWTTGAVAMCIGMGELYLGGVISAMLLIIYFVKDLVPINK